MPIMRLDKFFASQEILSRKEVAAAIKNASIKVDEKVASSADQKIDTEKSKISFQGNLVEYEPFVYLMLNKPQGVVSSTDDKINKTVLDLVPKELFRSDLFPAGRLDKDTVGFVLLTNDGDFAHKMLSPKNHVEKKYIVKLDNTISNDDIIKLSSGVTLASGEECKPATIKILEDTALPLLEVTLCEGKYHQIKRMFGIANCGVTYLKRTQMGMVILDANLAEGQCRKMLHKEVENILAKKLV